MIIKQYPFAAVKKQKTFFDVWQWNLYKMKWVRLVSARFSDEVYANRSAERISNEIEEMLKNNQKIPEPLVDKN